MLGCMSKRNRNYWNKPFFFFTIGKKVIYFIMYIILIEGIVMKSNHGWRNRQSQSHQI